jgi:hypothetical protein
LRSDGSAVFVPQGDPKRGADYSGSEHVRSAISRQPVIIYLAQCRAVVFDFGIGEHRAGQRAHQRGGRRFDRDRPDFHNGLVRDGLFDDSPMSNTYATCAQTILLGATG